MSEAQEFPVDAAPPQPFVVIEGIPRDPFGSFFDPIVDDAAVERLTTLYSKEQRALLAQEDADEIILQLLEQTGLLPADTNEEDADTTGKSLKDLKKVVKETIMEAGKFYRSEAFWEDFPHRKGQDIDRVELLHERVAGYANASPLHGVLEIINKQNPQNYHITDALRIVEIILLNETEDSEVDLP